MNAAEAPANPTPGSEPPTAVPRGAEGAPLRLRRLGLDHNLTARDLGRFHGLIEPPARISETRIFHDFSIGAFSYVSGGFLYHTHIGRYCSLANGLHIGQGNHPAAWLSTHPFQYQKLKFNVGEGYPDRGRYYEDIEQGATVSPPKPTRTVIGNDVWIAHGVYVRNGVTIGDGAVVGARAVVVADVPPYAIAVGNPARVIRLRFEPEIVEALLRLRWWRLPPWRLRGLDFSKVDDCVRKLETLVEDESAHYRPRKIRVTP